MIVLDAMFWAAVTVVVVFVLLMLSGAFVILLEEYEDIRQNRMRNPRKL